MLSAEPVDLISFKDQADLKRWSYRKLTDEAPGLIYENRFALRGPRSLKLHTPAWKPGGNEWPVWRLDRHFPSDWSRYDRLLIDLVNPTDTPALLGLKVADGPTSQVGTGNWLGVKVTVPPRSHLRLEEPLSKLLRGLIVAKMDQEDIHSILLYATRPTSDFHLYISSLTLLEPGEEAEPLSDAYQNELTALNLDPLLANGKAAVETLRADDPKAADLRAEWAALEKRLQSPSVRENLESTALEAETLTRKIVRSASLAPLRKQAQETGFAIAWAPGTEKVIPREMPLQHLKLTGPGTLSVARQEAEGIQVVVVPFEEALEKVRVTVGKLTREDGETLTEGSVSVAPVGFVKTAPAAYEVSYTGWWPDPLLPFLESVKVEPENAQTFWIRIKPGREQAAGTYRGEVTIASKGKPAIRRELVVKVRDFTLPSRPPIPMVLPAPNQTTFAKLEVKPWDKLKLEMANFMADYYIGWDNLYVPTEPDWEVLESIKKQSRLWQFNLYPIGFGGGRTGRLLLESGDYEAQLQALIAKIEPIYEEAKKRQLLEHAYLYGMDELPSRYFPALKTIAERVKEKFPELKIATTAMDYSHGRQSEADAVDIWIPLIHEYHPEDAAKARAEGKEVWWYNCKTPAHPYPNQFTEYPAIELRLMHGAMSALYQPDGFLYYSFFRMWKLQDAPDRKVIDAGPFTEWDPCALAFSPAEIYNGEGYLAYPGPGGTPLSSIRLENFRDGLEDLWYWKLLREGVERGRKEAPTDAARVAWLAKAESALVIPKDLVKSSHEFSIDPEQLHQWREAMAQLLEVSPYQP